MSAPTVPQRPARSQNSPSTASTDSPTPQVPPRPTRNSEKSKSPNRDFGTRSPLNDSPFAAPGLGFTSMSNAQDETAPNLGKRPSMTSLPLIGNEGVEYDSMEKVPQIKDMPVEPRDTRTVAGDLPLHAPTAGVANSRAAVAPVVRTDTAKAAELGLSKPSSQTDELHELGLQPTVSRSREYRPVSSSGLSKEITRELSRSASRGGAYEEELDEHGIPQIGQYVPMYPNAGDVQAPSPSPWQNQHATGIGFFNDSAKSPAQTPTSGRRKSAAGLFHGPSGSYGLHGHGVQHQDRFEKSWYEKHPEELKKEELGIHGSASMLDRPEWALSRDELDKLVRTSTQGGFGASETAIGVPTEAIGHQLTAEYTSRDASPALQPATSHDFQSSHESPLRSSDLPGGNLDHDKIHLDPTSFQDRYTQQGKGQAAGGSIPTRGMTPILASDEVARGSGSFMVPAVAAESQKHTNDEYYSDSENLPAWQRRQGGGSGRSSRRNSRPNSAAFYHHEPHSTGTPLNEIDEYEPLFNDDDELQRPITAADRLKRPELERRFPSQDIWEDTPNSLRLETTVGGPQEPEDITSPKNRSGGALFESPDAERKRQGEITESERRSFLDDSMNMTKAKPKFNAGVEGERRPGMARRFPSQDIWEDTPDYAQLSTTLDPEDAVLKSPTGGSVVAANNLAQGFAAADKSMAAPEVPARPARSKGAGPSEKETLDNQASPTKSKPEVPARPTRTTHAASESVPVERVISGGSSTSEITSPTEKVKPTVPSKPAQSSKFASIKAGFMENLNSRLQHGPIAKKAPEETREVEEEKAPLADARKGRAKGPARRAAPTAAVASTSGPDSWGFSSPKTHWSIGHSGLSVHPSTRKPWPSQRSQSSEQPQSATSLHVPTMTTGAPTSASPGTEKQARREELAQRDEVQVQGLESTDAAGDRPPPVQVDPMVTEESTISTRDVESSTKQTVPTEATAFVDEGRDAGSNLVAADGEVSDTLQQSQAAS